MTPFVPSFVSLRASVSVLLAALVVGVPFVAEAAPAGAAPGAAPVAPGAIPRAITGTIKGTVLVAKSDPANAEPLFKNTCADLVVTAKSSGGATSTATATGDAASGACTFTLQPQAGTYTFSATLGGAAVPVSPALINVVVAVTPGGTADAKLKVTFPLQPTANVIAILDKSGDSWVTCETTKVKVVHALKTFIHDTISLPGGRCKGHFNWVPNGPVTVSIMASTVNLPPPQTGTVAGPAPLQLDFALPKFARVSTNVRPAAYPAASPGLNCSPYAFKVKKDGTVLATIPLTADLVDCHGQTLLVIPPGVPVVYELTKAGAVVKTETFTLTALEDHKVIVTPLP